MSCRELSKPVREKESWPQSTTGASQDTRALHWALPVTLFDFLEFVQAPVQGASKPRGWLPAQVVSQESTENNRAVKQLESELYERVPFGLLAEWQTKKNDSGEAETQNVLVEPM